MPDFLPGGNSNVCIFPKLLLVKIVTWKVWPWKCRSRSLGVQHSQWSHLMVNINLYKSHTWVYFMLALTLFEIFTFQNLWPWKCKLMSWCTIFAVAPFDGKCPTSYLMAIVMLALSLSVCKMLANLIKFQNFDLENEGQGGKDRTYAIQLEIFDSI